MILTIDTFLALLAALVNFIFAILIIARTSRSTIYRTFFFICIFLMIWNFGDFKTSLTGNPFWFYLSLIGSGMVPAFGFHFITAMASPEKRKRGWIILVYLCSGFLAFSSLLALLIPEVKRFVDSAQWNILYLILLGPFLFASIIILVQAYYRNPSENEKSRLRYIVIAGIVAIFTGLTDLVQILKVQIPPLGHLGTVVYSSILAMGVFKHRKAYDILSQIETKLESVEGAAQEELRKSEEKYRTILHSLEEGYFEVDLAGNLTFFNEALIKFSGYSKEELMGMNNRQYMTEEATKKVYQTFNEVYQTGKPATPFDWEIILRDGTRKVLETSVSLMRDSKGQPIGFRGIARDVTYRKQAQVALQASEEKYRTILHSIEDGYYEVDLAGNMTFFNESMVGILGYPREEMLGMNNRRYMSEETAKKVYQTFNEVYRTGNPAKGFDWELIRKDGTQRFLETSVSLLRDSEGRPIGFYGIGRDVTERKRMEEEAKVHQQQLMQAGKMVALGTLVSSVAHEINNPNNFIMLNTPLLMETWESLLPILEEYYEENGDFVLGGAKYSEMRENIPVLFSGILDGSKRIKEIVEDLRDFVRRDTSDMTQSVDMNSVIKSAISLLSNTIRRSTSHFSVQYGTKLPMLRGNSHRLGQVIINLIQNACQALPDTQKGIFVSTSYHPKTSSLMVIIQDEGIGIACDDLPHIMDHFFTTKRDSGGIGLGLSISSRIVKEHGGTLTFTSECGKGTVAKIILPVIHAHQPVKGTKE